MVNEVFNVIALLMQDAAHAGIQPVKLDVSSSCKRNVHDSYVERALFWDKDTPAICSLECD